MKKHPLILAIAVIVIIVTVYYLFFHHPAAVTSKATAGKTKLPSKPQAGKPNTMTVNGATLSYTGFPIAPGTKDSIEVYNLQLAFNQAWGTDIKTDGWWGNETESLLEKNIPNWGLPNVISENEYDSIINAYNVKDPLFTFMGATDQPWTLTPKSISGFITA